ncbi:MAG: diguanylate cyclase domain-containing protein [Bradymonadaceae bacterium]
MNRVVNWFYPSRLTPESLRDEYDVEAARARLLLRFTSCVALVGIFFGFVAWPGMDAPVPSLLCFAGALSLLATRTVWEISGAVSWAGHWASFNFFWVLSTIVVMTDGLASYALGWLVVVPLFAIVFSGESYGTVWTGLVVVEFTLMYWFPGLSNLIANPFEPAEFRLLNYLVPLALLAAISWLFSTYRQVVRTLESVGAEYESQANADPLTVLPNRRAFQQRVDDYVRSTRNQRRQAVLGILDLDDFKLVNDTHGHDAGDALLVEVADRLTSLLRAGDFVARIGGDEFAILLGDIDTPSDLETVADRLRNGFAAPFVYEGTKLDVNCSIGFAMMDADKLRNTSTNDAVERLRQSADTVMYTCKNSQEDWSVERVV